LRAKNRDLRAVKISLLSKLLCLGFLGEISHANSIRASMVFRIAFHRPLLFVLRSDRNVECTARRTRMISSAISMDSWILSRWLIVLFWKCLIGIYPDTVWRSAYQYQLHAETSSHCGLVTRFIVRCFS